jgi:Zn-dependent protease with chaperone function
MRAVLGCLFCFLLSCTVGCAVENQTVAVNTWAAHEGGLLVGAREAKVQAVAAPLVACCEGRKISVQILNTDAVGAFSWANGRVFITRGLMDHLDDQELSAVIAHELGHLLTDGHLQTVASLKGCCEDPDAEVRADAAGVALLRTEGLSADAMVHMLAKVERYGSLPSACRSAMDHRIALLAAARVPAGDNR